MSKHATTLAHAAIARQQDNRGAHRAASPALGSMLEGVAEHALRKRLAGLRHGTLTLVDGDRHETYGAATPRCAVHATVDVRESRFYSEVAFGGSVGAGESYVAGDWRCDDLVALVRILAVNRDLLDGVDGGVSRLAELARRALHATARNTRSGSRRNITAHYDIGNDFFELFLDPSMMYSCAYYERPTMTLAEAQAAKLDRLCRKLDLRPSDHLLEIGTGWGALALHAAGHYGCRVTTTTISREQHALARRRIDAAGLADRIELRLDDYRDLDGRYDKLVSVEMIEAIGHQYFDTFFRRCGELLAPGGTMALQAITIDDRQYTAARDSVDFIKRHIFPGCCIPSLCALGESIVRASPLRVVDVEDIGPHYATTLAAWRRNLHANAGRIRARGYPDTLVRMWDFYLAYCEGGYAERALSNVQIVLQDPSTGAPPPPRV
jgi:cyclopropane-fatty-acyl-phospholipid synthase